jgi:hypothetical protein
VPGVRGSQPACHALVLAGRVVDDDLDRVDALGRPLACTPAPTRKLAQLGPQLVGDGLAEAHPHRAALAAGQPEPIVKPDRHVHASAHQPPAPVGAPDTPPLGAQHRVSVDRCRRERRPARTGSVAHVPPFA